MVSRVLLPLNWEGKALLSTRGLKSGVAWTLQEDLYRDSWDQRLSPLLSLVPSILPGPIRTGMTERITEEQKGTYARRRVPLRRYGEPEEVAHGTLALVLPSASYVGFLNSQSGWVHCEGLGLI